MVKTRDFLRAKRIHTSNRRTSGKVKSSNASDTETVMYVIGWILNALLLGGRYGGKFVHLIQIEDKELWCQTGFFLESFRFIKGRLKNQKKLVINNKVN